MPGKYLERARTAITQPLEHLFKVTAVPATGDPFPLAVESDSITVQFSEDWSPHVQADLSLPVPGDAQLAALDGRKRCRLLIEAGYRYPDQTLDVHPLADLLLLDRKVSRPSNVLTLEASSDEILAQDRQRTDADALPNFAGVNSVMNFALQWALYPDTYSLSSDFSATYGSAYTQGLDLPIGSDWWGLMADVANQVNVWVYCDETRRWQVRKRAELGTPSHHLAVGENGTIFSTDSGLGRSEWANYALIKYQFDKRTPTTEDPKKTTPTTIYGRAKVSGGPFSVNAVGYRMYSENRDITVTQAGADSAARAVLSQLSTRGRSLTLDAAAAYWVRPGQTITVQLPTGDLQTHLVASVTFRPGTGEMTIKTRLPEDVTITTGE